MREEIVILRPETKPQPEELTSWIGEHGAGIMAIGRFGKHEVERAAGRLVSFLIHRRMGWASFTYRELIMYYDWMKWPTDDVLFGLTGPWLDDGEIMVPRSSYLVHGGSCLLFTEEFLRRVR
jgi:hypothetical protein